MSAADGAIARLGAARVARLAEEARELVSELRLDQILDRLLAAARELTDARYAAIGVLDEDRSGLAEFITSGVGAERRRLIGDPPRGRGVLGLLIDDPRPLRLHDVAGHPQSYGVPTHHPAIDTFLGVPVVVHGQAWGNLYLGDRADGRDFDDDDEQTAVILARWAAIAIENARLGMRWGEVLVAGAPLRIADVPADPTFPAGLLGASDAACALLVPMLYRRTSIGVLVAVDAATGGFDAGDEELLRAFATSAATAVVTGQSVAIERLRAALRAAEAERSRWARELHDETLQALAGIQILLDAAAADGSADGLRAAVAQAGELVGDEIAALRSLIAELRPPALDELGLAPALESLVRRVAGGEGLIAEAAVDLGANGDGALPAELETAVYRVAQEALTNVAKHAGARHVRLRVERSADAVSLTVADDGAGFDPAAPSRGFGLTGMRERVALAGGALTVDARPGGTTIRARFPVVQRGSSSSPRSSA